VNSGATSIEYEFPLNRYEFSGLMSGPHNNLPVFSSSYKKSR